MPRLYPEKWPIPALLLAVTDTDDAAAVPLNTITRPLMRLMGIKTDIVWSAGRYVKRNYVPSCMNPARKISRRNCDMLPSVLRPSKRSAWRHHGVPRNEIIDRYHDDCVVERQLTHSPHGRIVLYRDSLG